MPQAAVSSCPPTGRMGSASLSSTTAVRDHVPSDKGIFGGVGPYGLGNYRRHDIGTRRSGWGKNNGILPIQQRFWAIRAPHFATGGVMSWVAPTLRSYGLVAD